MDPNIKQVLLAILSGVIVALFIFIINRLKTKTSSDVEIALSELKNQIIQIRGLLFPQEERTKLTERLITLEVQFSMLSSSHTTLMTELKNALIEVAHSPHTPELDELLDKSKQGELADGDYPRLIAILTEQAKHEPQDSNKQMAMLGLRAIFRTEAKIDKIVASLHEHPELEAVVKRSLWERLRDALRRERSH